MIVSIGDVAARPRGVHRMLTHGDPNALYDRHLLFDYAIDPDLATPRERYEAVARSLRDVLALRGLRAKKSQYNLNPKRAYYLSMEFLIGRQ